MDVYVEVSILGYAKNTKRTFIDKKGGTTPKWNYTIKFTLDEPSLTKSGLSLCFRIRSSRLFGDKDIGIVSIPINDIFRQSNSGPDGSDEKIAEYQVFTPVNTKPKGTLKFSYKFGKKYEQPSEPMYKNVNQRNSNYNNQNMTLPAYPYAQTGANNNMPPPGMGYGMPNPNHGLAYQQPAGGAYPPPANYNGSGFPSVAGYPIAGNPPTGYPPSGYGYVQQQQQQHQQQAYGAYPPAVQPAVQKPQKKSTLGVGAGVGMGLAGGLLGGVLVNEMVHHVRDDMDDAYDQGYDDAREDMDY